MTVTFTGSRPGKLCGFNHTSYSDFVQKLAVYLYTKFGDNTTFITGSAQGFDQLAFWAVDLIKTAFPNSHGIKNIVYIPFPDQGNRWKKTGPFSQEEFKQMLDKADEVKILGENSNKSVGVLLQLRNEAMINDSDIVIALYPDDSWRTAKGSGTANCMVYADKKHCPILQIRYTIKDNKLIMPDEIKPAS